LGLFTAIFAQVISARTQMVQQSVATLSSYDVIPDNYYMIAF